MGERLSTVLMHPLLLVAAGGAIGSVLRYVLSRAIDGTIWHGGMPWGTFAINVAGSFFIGFFVVAFLERPVLVHREAFLLLGTGLCGGFTTFSTFEWETYRLLREGQWPTALGYVFGSVISGLAATFAGVCLAMQIFGHRS